MMALKIMQNIENPSNHPLFEPNNLLEYIENIGVKHCVHHHAPVFTVAEANLVTEMIPGVHTRNLFIRDKRENMFLITLRDETRLDLKKLAGLLGVGKLSFGSPERLWAYLGVRPGSVTPLSVLNDTERKVRLVLEQAMMEEDIVNFHPLDNSMTISLSPDGLMTILKKQGITPHILDLSPAAPEESKD